MPKRNWVDGQTGNTPLSAARLNDLENDLDAAMVQLARDPSLLFSGAVVHDANGAPTSASIAWPDGVVGVYSGTVSAVFAGAIDAYTITRTGTPTLTYTQPAVTRDGDGEITNRPPLVIT